MKYEHRFVVAAPVEAVAAFHRDPASMAAITPPPIIVQVHAAPPVLASGARMDFTLWAGPIPIRWVACIENVSAGGFTDRQLEGPFGAWLHRHAFERVDGRTTAVVDQIEATYSPRPLWAIIGRLMWLGMPLLFAFRARRTRALLERS